METVINDFMIELCNRENLINYKYEFATDLNKKDGFASNMFHVILEAKDNNKNRDVTLNLFIKFGPMNEKHREYISVGDLYKREIFFYEVMTPLMSKILAEKKLPNLDFLLKCYVTSNVAGREAMVFENLKSAGYELYNCQQPMNHEHIEFVLKCYGKYHALGFLLKPHHEKWFSNQNIRQSVFNWPNFIGFKHCLNSTLDVVAKELYAPEDSEVLQSLLKFKINLWKFFTDPTGFTGEDDKYLTLVHGDCWCNNMMFKYESASSKSGPIAMKHLDFQCIFLGSPVFDFAYFFYANASVNMYDKVRDYTDIFYNSLSEQLAELGYDSKDVYPRHIFEAHLKTYLKYGFVCGLLPIYMRYFKDDIKSFDDLQGVDFFEQFSITNQKHENLKEYFSVILPFVRHFHKQGLL